MVKPRKPFWFLPAYLPEKPRKLPPYSGVMFLLILFIGFLLLMARKKPFWEIDEDGERRLMEWREKKLRKELNRIDNAEQYALLAKTDGFFICYSCDPDTIIYLYKGEVWKYGVTTQGQSGRYAKGFPENNLDYRIQFRGAIGECMKEEKRKIYFYPILKENVKRDKPIDRPPGNKRDD